MKIKRVIVSKSLVFVLLLTFLIYGCSHTSQPTPTTNSPLQATPSPAQTPTPTGIPKLISLSIEKYEYSVSDKSMVCTSCTTDKVTCKQKISLNFNLQLENLQEVKCEYKVSDGPDLVPDVPVGESAGKNGENAVQTLPGGYITKATALEVCCFLPKDPRGQRVCKNTVLEPICS